MYSMTKIGTELANGVSAGWTDSETKQVALEGNQASSWIQWKQAIPRNE